MKVTEENIRNIFKEEVDESVDVSALAPDEDFIDFGVDSLDRSSVFLSIEDNFGVHIPDVDVESVRTINKIIEYLNEKIAS